MFELIFLTILILSFCGALFILARKIPVLNNLPRNGTTGIRKHRIILNAENKFKDTVIYFEKQIFLHKFLSWVKCLTIRTEVKLDNLLHNIRKKTQKIDRELKEKK